MYINYNSGVRKMVHKYRFTVILLLLSSLVAVAAIKKDFGGTAKIRLNEPSDFNVSTSSYSDMVFYSLIYENFFYLGQNGDITSNIFKDYRYDAKGKRLVMSLKPHLKFSDGSAISTAHIVKSLERFLDTDSAEAKRLKKYTRQITSQNRQITLMLNFDYPDILGLMTIPQLVVLSQSQSVFSGSFYPTKWVKGKQMILKGNPHYLAGIPYLDNVQIDFENYYYPDIFLAKPGIETEGEHREYRSNVYQNYYISFPKGKIGRNTRIAFYSLLKNFFAELEYPPLNVLTSEAESPLSINIKRFSKRKIRTILRYSNIKLYVVSTLKHLESQILEYFKKYKLNIEIIFIKDSNLSVLMSDTNVKYLILEKVFHSGVAFPEKIKKIVKGMSFYRFNELYFGLIEQLDEIMNLKDSELLMEHISGIIQKIISDGYLLPLSQKKYALYLKKKLKGITIDYYGRPLLHRGHYSPYLLKNGDTNESN